MSIFYFFLFYQLQKFNPRYLLKRVNFVLHIVSEISPMKIWKEIQLITDAGELKPAIAPLIISASRSTDIPAFHSEWLINRLRKGYVCWINPFHPTNPH